MQAVETLLGWSSEVRQVERVVLSMLPSTTVLVLLDGWPVRRCSRTELPMLVCTISAWLLVGNLRALNC